MLLRQRQSVDSLFTTLWQLFWESRDFRCRNIISERFCNDIATLSQRRIVVGMPAPFFVILFIDDLSIIITDTDSHYGIW